MFVLTDIEWMTNSAGHFSPTQLSAIKVDENWNEIDRFDSLIRPRDSEFHDWKHVAYTGGSATEFLHARNAHNVIQSFLEWLNEDDVILWWYEESDAIFKKLVSLIFKKKVTNRTVAINGYVYAFLAGQENSKGNSYKIAAARGIDVHPNQMHCSINDAVVMQKLMKKICLPQGDLLKPVLHEKKEWHPSVKEKDMPHQYDPKTNMIHNKDCPVLLISGAVTKGFETWKTPLKKGYKPCDCCKEEYQNALRERNLDTLERTQYTYVYSADSKVFHKYSCGVMLSAKSILGTRKYETVIKTGRIPCKLCNPTPEDVYRPLPVQLKVARLQKKTKKMVAKEDAKAILRQKLAAEERYRRLSEESLTQQERNDIYTLTQPRFAFWVGQGYQTFHLRSCPKLQEVSNLRGFSTYKGAIRAGCTPCRKCKPTAKHDIKVSIPITNRVREDEKVEDLEAMCTEAGYEHHREGAYLYLETPVGKWRINVSESPVKLDHINLVKTPGTKRYHEQPRIFLSYIDTFDYIKRHDEELAKKSAEGRVYVKLFEE